MCHTERWFVSSSAWLGENHSIYLFAWFCMKSLLAGQPLPRPSQAAVFHSCAVKEGELPPLVMWAELLARSAPAQPNPVFAMSILLGCPLLLWVWKCPWENLAHQVSCTHWSSAGKKGRTSSGREHLLLLECDHCQGFHPSSKADLSQGPGNLIFSGEEGK